MQLYHVTSLAAAEAIRRQGFRDTCDSLSGLIGVWLADRVIDFCSQDGAVLLLDLPEMEVLEYEVPCEPVESFDHSTQTWTRCPSEGPFRAFCVPATLVNRYSVTLVSPMTGGNQIA